jgi:RNase P protein component
MRYEHGFAVTIPYLTPNEDGTNRMERALLHTNDAVDRRRIKRILRRWVRDTLGRTLYTHEMRLLMRNVRKHTQPMQYMRMPGA